jgi:anti-anti-sigma regulatory factor
VNNQSPIFYAVIGDLTWIRVEGRGSYSVSPHLREFATHELSQGRVRFVLDLENCQCMDSTFMGTLLAVSRNVAKSENGLFDVINANARNVQLMKNLGLDLVLSVDERSERWGDQRKEIDQLLTVSEAANYGKRETAAVMLDAHEALAAAQPENAARFHDVIHYLQEELASSSESD